ncbi:MAG: DUF5668 domain-containing protein [Spirochaetales bacterium]|jgi:hypothetical protein|nr:DUF5668 domain-containing protein [Spirochaetales bacterium]
MKKYESLKKLEIRFPRKMLVAGAIFLVAGGALLLRTTGFLIANFSLWPVGLVLVGIFLLHRVYFRQGADAHVFSSIFLILAGSFLLVLNTGVLESDFKQFWPLFMLFTGVSLFFFGLKKKGAARLRMTIPALAIIMLSLLFLLFSLRIISVSLRDFVVTWWPGILVFAGIMLISLDVLVERRERKKNSGNSSAS